MRPLYLRLLLLITLILAIFRVADTYHRFSPIYDEPAKILYGMEWLDRGTFQFQALHPPLPLIMVAILPYIDGIRLPPVDYKVMVDRKRDRGSVAESRSLWRMKIGNRLLEESGDPERTLTLARLGTLPFFALTLLSTFLIGRKLYGQAVGAGAAFLLSYMPFMLANAGLATNDMAQVGTLVFACFIFLRWLENPVRRETVFLSFAIALALLSKMSNLVFIPVSFLVIALAYYKDQRQISPVIHVPGMVGAVQVTNDNLPRIEWRKELYMMCFIIIVLIAIFYRYGYFLEWIHGIQAMMVKNSYPLPTYILGVWYDNPEWWFIPASLLIATPLSLLILAMFGVVVTPRNTKRTWLKFSPIALIVVYLVMGSQMGGSRELRYLIGLMPCMALLAGVGAVILLDISRTAPQLWQRIGSFAVLATLLLSFGISSANTHPHYLSYQNILADRMTAPLLIAPEL